MLSDGPSLTCTSASIEHVPPTGLLPVVDVFAQDAKAMLQRQKRRQTNRLARLSLRNWSIRTKWVGEQDSTRHRLPS